jgi:RNA polymerase subunit RPABC4/transcription elongation factor Spt4
MMKILPFRNLLTGIRLRTFQNLAFGVIVLSVVVRNNVSMKNTTMTTCPDCGASVSKRATACPSCGAPQKAATNTGTRVVVRTVALLAAILAALVAWSSYNVDSTAAASNAAVWGGISGLSLFAFVRLLRA